MAKKKTDAVLRARLRAWVRYLMLERSHLDGHSQKEFARKIGIPAPTLNKILNDSNAAIGIDTLARIRHALHQSIDRMVDDDPPTVAQGVPASPQLGAGGGCAPKHMHRGA